MQTEIKNGGARQQGRAPLPKQNVYSKDQFQYTLLSNPIRQPQTNTIIFKTRTAKQNYLLNNTFNKNTPLLGIAEKNVQKVQLVIRISMKN